MSMEPKLPAPHVDQGEGYERSDADVRTLLRFGFSLFVILVAVFFSMWGMFLYFGKSQQLGPPASPFENPRNARILPPQPRLQVQPHVDLQAYCDAQMKELNSYAMVDPNNDVVRIPVDRAMTLIIARGLPSRPVANATPDGTAAADAAAAPLFPDSSGAQGQCGYLVKPPPKDEK